MTFALGGGKENGTKCDTECTYVQFNVNFRLCNGNSIVNSIKIFLFVWKNISFIFIGLRYDGESYKNVIWLYNYCKTNEEWHWKPGDDSPPLNTIIHMRVDPEMLILNL